MVASHYRKYPTRIGKNTFFDVFHPSPVHSYWNIVFRFTGSRTGMTTDTLSIVDDKSVFHKIVSLKMMVDVVL